jgi:glycosyltransferase involved in cell wall biosynthesis
MAASPPEISVVVATHDRAGRLAALLQSLREQTASSERFEVIVVDDASSDETPSLLDRELARGELRLRVVRSERSGGPATARNIGWRAAGAPLVAFIDDDCVAVPSWLEEGLRASAATPGAIIQGRVDPIPAESSAVSPFTRTLRIHTAGPYYQTCNIFYPRSLLDELAGFDEFFTMPGGEDTDLAWRAISTGTPTAFADRAQAYHAVNRIGPMGRLRVAAHWHESMVVYKRHPELRRAVFTKQIFWKPWHYALFRVALALALPQRLWFLRPYLVLPYLRSIELRCRNERGGLAHALFYPIEDAVEVGAMVRASIRHRMLVL